MKLKIEAADVHGTWTCAECGATTKQPTPTKRGAVCPACVKGGK
jgi:rubrerythrin